MRKARTREVQGDEEAAKGSALCRQSEPPSPLGPQPVSWTDWAKGSLRLMWLPWPHPSITLHRPCPQLTCR